MIGLGCFGYFIDFGGFDFIVFGVEKVNCDWDDFGVFYVLVWSRGGGLCEG